MLRMRRVLTLEERVAVVKVADSGKSCPSIASELDVGKTQIQSMYSEGEG